MNKVTISHMIVLFKSFEDSFLHNPLAEERTVGWVNLSLDFFVIHRKTFHPSTMSEKGLLAVSYLFPYPTPSPTGTPTSLMWAWASLLT
jgi:hypothetical protein